MVGNCLRQSSAWTLRSVSAFSPIVSPLHCPWGEKALGGYLGTDKGAWRAYDACALIDDGARVHGFLCESEAVERAQDISSFGGWKPYLRALGTSR